MHLVIDAPPGGHLPDLVACQQAFIGHELPNHFVALQGLARLLAQGNLQAGEAEHFAQRIAALARRVDGVTRRLGDLGRTLAEPAWGLPLAIGPAALEAAAEVKGKFPNFHLTVEVEGSEVRVPCSGRLLHRVFGELFLNAAQAANPVRITMSAQEDGSGVRVVVQDNGPGLTEDARRLLLEPFAASRQSESSGTGLGFFFVRQAAALWKARLEVHSAPLQGLRVQLDLPLMPPECP